MKQGERRIKIRENQKNCSEWGKERNMDHRGINRSKAVGVTRSWGVLKRLWNP